MNKRTFLNYLHNADTSDITESQAWFHGYAMCLHDQGVLGTAELLSVSAEITKIFEED